MYTYIVEIYQIIMDFHIKLHPVQKYSACLILALHAAPPKNKPGTQMLA